MERRIRPALQAILEAIEGIGNILRHEYHRVSDTIVWNVVQEHLPTLREAVSFFDATLRE